MSFNSNAIKKESEDSDDVIFIKQEVDLTQVPSSTDYEMLCISGTLNKITRNAVYTPRNAHMIHQDASQHSDDTDMNSFICSFDLIR